MTPGRVALAWRALVITTQVGLAVLRTLVEVAGIAGLRGRAAAGRHAARRTTGTVTRLGPTFIKVGQILGTRRDLLPRLLCDELSRLRDEVAPLSPERSRAALAGVYGADLDRVFAAVDYSAIAGGSVACVYRAVLRDRTVVAVKLQRPAIREVMAADLALLRTGAALVSRLPVLREVPVRELVDNLCEVVLGQLDFAREAASQERIRTNLAVLPRIRVPRVRPDATRPTCIVMEFVPDLEPATAHRCSVATRRGFAAATLGVLYQMIFIDGFVHCDLHPGNLYFLPTGQVVVLDAGFSTQLSERMRRLFADFFLNMAVGRGTRCAEIVIESALRVPAGVDRDGFVRALADLVQRNHGVAARDFSLIKFATEMFRLQRDYGISAAPDLVFPLLSLLVIEATVRHLDPDVDFQAAARPVLMKAVFAHPAKSTA